MAFSQGQGVGTFPAIEMPVMSTLDTIPVPTQGRAIAEATVGAKAKVSDSKMATMVRRKFIGVDFLS